VRYGDVARQQVAATPGNISYDFLILSLGAELAPEAVPGLKDGTETFYTFEGAIRLRCALSRFSGGRVATVVAATAYKCPGAPHEGAMLICDYLRKRGLSVKSELHLTPEPQPRPVAGRQLGDAGSKCFNRKVSASIRSALSLPSTFKPGPCGKSGKRGR
jgi:sulfide:quinone oxidoreductase